MITSVNKDFWLVETSPELAEALQAHLRLSVQVLESNTDREWFSSEYES